MYVILSSCAESLIRRSDRKRESLFLSKSEAGKAQAANQLSRPGNGESSGGNSAVECQLPKLDVAGSIPVPRSILFNHLQNLLFRSAPFLLH